MRASSAHIAADAATRYDSMLPSTAHNQISGSPSPSSGSGLRDTLGALKIRMGFGGGGGGGGVYYTRITIRTLHKTELVILSAPIFRVVLSRLVVRAFGTRFISKS